jgi:tRNA 2-thiouridine synthesizing protein E
MRILRFDGKTFELDTEGFLVDPKKWEPALAEGLALAVDLAAEISLPGGLTKEHWDVINYIRSVYEETGKCPNLFETCRANNLQRNELKRLFPSGYMRGACRLAGLSYKEAYLGADYMEHSAVDLHGVAQRLEYRVDVRGFLVDPDEWDEHYAAHRAFEMKIPGGKLTKRHWEIIRYLRKSFYTSSKIPTIWETCEANDIELDELEMLFPDGYHRGAVKLAGLRLR